MTKRQNISTPEPTQVTVTFKAEDVQSVFDINLDQAEEWLCNNWKHLRDRMCQAGNEAIETLGDMDGLPPTAQEQAEQCDLCGVHVPNGEGRYREDDRVCEDCDSATPTPEVLPDDPDLWHGGCAPEGFRARCGLPSYSDNPIPTTKEN